MLDVMVFTPVYRLEPESVQAILALEWAGPLTFVFQEDNPAPVPVAADDIETKTIGVKNHLHQYRRGRELFLSSRSDSMLIVESDIIPPPDTIQRLAALDADLAYGCYLFRESKVVNIFERYQNGAINTGESLSCHPGKWEAARAAGVIPCSGGGLGCVLIKRPVIEKIEFRITPLGLVHCDSFFTEDAYRAGFTMLADTNVLCGHKTAAGVILWPQGADHALS